MRVRTVLPHAPFLTKLCKEGGREKRVRIAPGQIALSSGQEIADLHQPQYVIALALDDGLLARMASESRGEPIPELRLEPAAQDGTLNNMMLALSGERRAGAPGGTVFSQMLG